MAKYPIKLLKDESGAPFVPLTTSTALYLEDGKNLDDKFATKLEASNIKAGKDITVNVDGNNVTINNASKGVLIDNLTTETSGQGSLDAHQGKVLKDLIPEVINNLTTIDSTKALSAHQGYILAGRSVPSGGVAGQVLKKSADDNYSLEWGDAADPNAIIGDGSIKKIVYLTMGEYNALKTINPDTEYHIQETDGDLSYISRDDIQKMIAEAILADKKKNYPIGKIEINISGANPSTYLGFGTWVAWGIGKVPIGVDISDGTINKADLSVGSKTVKYKPAGTNEGTAVTFNAVSLSHSGGAVQSHTLTVNEMPSHNHVTRVGWNDASDTAANVKGQAGTGMKLSVDQGLKSGDAGGSKAHGHGFTQPSAHSFTPTIKSITQPTFTGTEATINVQQPSISCYMWKRTA